MPLISIKKEKDYKKALERLKTIFDSKKDRVEGGELEILSILTDKYKNEKFSCSASKSY